MTTHTSTPTSSPTNAQHTQANEAMIWSSRIELSSLDAHEATQSGARRLAGHGDSGDGGQQDQPRTSQIEREIIWAVVVLYAAIIACFAGLHLLGVALFE